MLSFITLGGIVTDAVGARCARASPPTSCAGSTTSTTTCTATRSSASSWAATRTASRCGELVIDGDDARTLAQQRHQLPCTAVSPASARSCGRSSTPASTTPRWADPAVTLRHVSADGEQGFPGRVDTRVTYSLGADRTLARRLRSHHRSRDRGQPEPPRLLQPRGPRQRAGPRAHGAGRAATTRSTPTSFRPASPSVDDTPFDFRALDVASAPACTTRTRSSRWAGGYDHNWILDDARHRHAAPSRRELEDPVIGPRDGRCTRPSPHCSSTRATSSTARSSATGGEAYRPRRRRSAWSRSTAPIRRITRTGRQHGAATRAKRTAAAAVYVVHSWNSVKPRPTLFCRSGCSPASSRRSP